MQEVIQTTTGTGEDATVTTDTLSYYYDANSTPLAVDWNGALYYYVTNPQGDVMALVDSTGTAVINYTYDAWGNILSTNGVYAASLGEHNALKYRGYVYDAESGLYYLQSRYYDPAKGRFNNADTFPSTGQGFSGNNMFAYCGNNPVNRTDCEGYFWDTVFDVVSLVISIIEVVQDPSDVGAWVGLALDTVDVVLPFVSGLGEIADAVNAGCKVSEAANKISDTRKAAEVATKSARSSAVKKRGKMKSSRSYRQVKALETGPLSK